MAAPKKNHIVKEAEAAYKANYSEPSGLELTLRQIDADAYAAAARKHEQRQQDGNYGLDSLLLVAVYEGLSTGDVEHFIEAAAIAIAIGNHISPEQDDAKPTAKSTAKQGAAPAATAAPETTTPEVEGAPSFDDEDGDE
jgi:hypothetical protein